MQDRSAFEQAGDQGRQSLVREFFGFVKTYRKWWLIPVLVVFLLLGVLVVLGGTGAAPFLYTLF